MAITCGRFDFEINISKNLEFPREFEYLTVSPSMFEFILKEEVSESFLNAPR